MPFTTPYTQEQLKAISVVSRFNDVIGNALVLKSLLSIGRKEWEGFVNEGTGAHLISKIQSTGFKTDAIHTYISKLVKVFMNSQGANLGAWTKDSLANEHSLTTAVVSRMSATLYKEHDELFIDVAVRLLGFDNALVQYAISDKPLWMVGYVSSQFDDIPAAQTAELYYGKLVEHFPHLSIADRDEVMTRAIFNITESNMDGYDAMLDAIQTVIGYAVGAEDKVKDKVFTFGAAQY